MEMKNHYIFKAVIITLFLLYATITVDLLKEIANDNSYSIDFLLYIGIIAIIIYLLLGIKEFLNNKEIIDKIFN